MLVRPPDRLVIQSHTPNVLEDLERLQALAQRCRLEINLSVETDMDPMPTGFPRHMYPPHQRIAALAALRAVGLTTVGVVSPLLPLADVETFARDLESACERVILDHYLVGDGSANGLRTRRSRLPQLLSDVGFARWTRLNALWEVEAVFRRVFRDDARVCISRGGFNRTELAPVPAAPLLF